MLIFVIILGRILSKGERRRVEDRCALEGGAQERMLKMTVAGRGLKRI
jgi:hypothetical protein